MTRLFCGAHELDLAAPAVMGILNLTPDSFYDGGRYRSTLEQLRQVEKMIEEGAAIIDIGAVSTRPGAEEVGEEEEYRRLMPSLDAVVGHFPGCIVSVDTFRPRIAREAVRRGAVMINDIYGGRYDDRMMDIVAGVNIPYIIMHMQGAPANMQDNPVYTDPVAEIACFFEKRLEACREKRVKQVVIDPGFGFGKTVQQNFTILARLREFKAAGVPVAVGLSRKSMISKTLKINASEALNGTTVLNTIALLNGADILRVHDVREAMEAVRLVGNVKEPRDT